MRTAKSIGRTVGFLILAQIAGGIVLNFVLLRPLATPPGFLESAGGSSLQLGAAALLGLLLGALWIAVAVVGWPVFRRCSQRLALWLLALGAVVLSLAAAEGASVMSMLSLSQAHASSGAADPGLFEALGGVVRSARRWAHYPMVLVGGATTLVLYVLLYRFSLVPRVLAAAGLVAALLQMTAVAMPFFGRDVVWPMIAPLAVVHTTLALWLVVKGLEERPELAGVGGDVAAL